MFQIYHKLSKYQDYCVLRLLDYHFFFDLLLLPYFSAKPSRKLAAPAARLPCLARIMALRLSSPAPRPSSLAAASASSASTAAALFRFSFSSLFTFPNALNFFTSLDLIISLRISRNLSSSSSLAHITESMIW